MKVLSYNKIIIYVYILISVSFSFIQCRKGSETIVPNDTIPVLVSGSISGIVTNELALPESDVLVSHNGTTVKTDKNGVFILKDQLLNKAGAQIKFMKQGYYTIHKSVIPIKNKLVSTKVQLVPRKLTKVINSATGGVAITNGAAQVALQSNSVIDASGKIYNGPIQVYSYWMDPTKENTFIEMPGNLTGRNLDGKEVVLQTLGMMTVELEDQSGNPLNIAPDKTAELKIPIAASLDSKAKTTIPMWYYDATKGGWIEDGISTRAGLFYVSKVSHFTYWNWDFSFPLINLKFRIVDLTNRPLGQVYLDVVDEVSGQHGSGETNPDGTFEGKIPASSSFTMTIGDRNCVTPIIYKFTSGTTDKDLGDISINIPSKHIFGKIVDCNKQIISNGYIQIWFGTSKLVQSFFIDASGAFDLNIATCSLEQINYKVIDLDHQKESSTGVLSPQSPIENDLGYVLACNELESYFIMNVDGKLDQQIFQISQRNYGANKRIIIYGVFADSLNFDTLYFDIPLFSIGTSSPNRFKYESQNNGYYFSCNGNCNAISNTIIEFGAIGESIKGNFLGQIVNNQNSKSVNIDGSFKFKREY